MKFLYDVDQRELQRSTRGLIARRLGGGARAVYESPDGMDMDLWREGAALGWCSMLVPEALGGGSLTPQGLVDAAALAEEWGRALLPGPLTSLNVAALALATCGSPEHQALLPDVVGGSSIVLWCGAEAGPDPTVVTTTASPSNSGWVLTGAKSLVEHAGSADHFLVTARDGDGVGEWLVPAGAPGVTVSQRRSLDLTRRLATVHFDDVALPAPARLPGANAAAVAHHLDVAAVLVCADSVGGAARVLELTVDYAKDRVQFGRPIASFQAIKHRCADLLIAVEGARAASRYAALAVADGTPDAPLAVDLAKAHVGEVYAGVAGEGIQLHGGIGFTWDHDMHLFARRAKLNEIMHGTPRWRRDRAGVRLASMASQATGS